MTLTLSYFGGTLRDLRGQVGRFKMHYNVNYASTADIGSAVTVARATVLAVEAISYGSLVGASGLAAEIYNPSLLGETGSFPNAEDKAVLVALCADFTLMRIAVPMPIAGIFLADQETVNLAAAGVAALFGELTSDDAGGGSVCNVHGSPVISPAEGTGFVAGYRVRRKFQRKTTIWTLTPQLSSPEE
jgi:hypothetical protein